MLSAICFNLDQSKNLSSGNELKYHVTVPAGVPRDNGVITKMKAAHYGSLLLIYYLCSAFGLKYNNIQVKMCRALGPYSPTTLMHILGLVLQIILYSEALECNTAADWLNHTV